MRSTLNQSSIPLEDLRFGDLDGDRRTDVFTTQKLQNAVRHQYSSGGSSRWIWLTTG